jgi:hypothetical protein
MGKHKKRVGDRKIDWSYRVYLAVLRGDEIYMADFPVNKHARNPLYPEWHNKYGDHDGIISPIITTTASYPDARVGFVLHGALHTKSTFKRYILCEYDSGKTWHVKPNMIDNGLYEIKILKELPPHKIRQELLSKAKRSFEEWLPTQF